LKLFDSPLFLLLSTGLLLGAYMPLGKFVGAAGIDPVLWALVISLVPGLVLTGFAGGVPMRFAFFGLVSGLTAYVIPNSLAFAAIPHVGAGYVGLMYAISPVFTALISLALNIRPPNRQLLLSVMLGFAGALVIVFSRHKLAVGADSVWPMLAFLIPLSLACGNVWRTARWPEGASPIQVGAISNLGAVPILLLVLAFGSGISGVAQAAAHPHLIGAQIILSLVMFSVFFRLQWIGGPTYLSQIGYVAAAVGLAFGTLMFGEHYPWHVWAGASAIAAGIAVSTWRPPD
jgi:drug/metabolite transporter (DMT)-like permease